MLLARRPLISTAIAVAMLVGLMSWGEPLCAAESGYEEAIAALEDAGALLSYSDENTQPPDRRKAVTEVRFYTGTEAAAIESLRHLRSLPHPERVDLVFAGFNAAFSKKLLEHVEVLPKLKGFLINIDADLPVSDAEICELSRMPTLSQLALTSLERVDITDKSLACLKKLRGLRTLSLTNTRITDAGLVHLSGMKRLEQLNLADTEVSGEGLRRLKDVPLRRLFLNATKVNDEHLQWFSDFEQLELLFLGGCPIDGSGLKYLSGLKQLRRLSLTATQIDDKALLHLQQLPQLDELSLGECSITDAGVPALAKLKGLKHLIVSQTKLSDAGRQKLSEALPNTQIE